MIRTATLAAALALTTLAPSLAQASPGWTTSGVNFREGPGTWHPVIAYLPRCAVLDVGRSEGGWAFVNWQGTWGWVAQRYVSGANSHCTWRAPSYSGAYGRRY